MSRQPRFRREAPGDVTCAAHRSPDDLRGCLELSKSLHCCSSEFSVSPRKTPREPVEMRIALFVESGPVTSSPEEASAGRRATRSVPRPGPSVSGRAARRSSSRPACHCLMENTRELIRACGVALFLAASAGARSHRRASDFGEHLRSCAESTLIHTNRRSAERKAG